MQKFVALASSSLGGLGLQRALGDLDQFAKGRIVCRGEVSKDLAVDFNLGRLETFDEPAVGHAHSTRRGVDSNLPQIAEGTLLGAAIAERVLAPVIHCIRSVAVKFGTAHPEAFGGADHPCTAFAGSWSVCNSHDLVDGKWLNSRRMLP